MSRRGLPAVLVVLALSAGTARAAPWQAIVPDARTGDNALVPLDLAANAPGPPLAAPAGGCYLSVAMAPDARTAYAAGACTGTVVPIDLTTSPPRLRAPISMAERPALGQGPNPQWLAVSPDGRTLLVSDVNNNAVLPVDLTGRSPRLEPAIRVAGAPRGVAFAPDSRTAYVVDESDGSLVPIDVPARRAGRPITGLGSQPIGVALTPDGRRAYVTANLSGAVYPVTLASRTVGARIAVPAGPLGIAVAPSGAVAYVASFGPASNGSGTGSTLTPIDLAGGVARAPITVGGGPWAVAVTPDGRTVYVTNSNDATVTPVDAATGTPGAAVPVGASPRGIAITPDQPPVPRFTVRGAAPGAPATFDATGSSIRFNAIGSYTWDFGDGTPPVTTRTPVVTHVYAGSGLRQATLTERSSAASAGSVVNSFAVGASAVAPPVLGKTVVVAPRGRVLVRTSGASRFRRLRSAADVRTGSELDTRAGVAVVTVAHDASQQTDTARVSGGIVRVTQTRRAPARTTFALTGRLRGCAAGTRAAAAKRRGPGRRVVVREKSGSFTTKGKYVAASVEGTTWATSDGCASSAVEVSSGLVRVRNLVTGKTVVLGPRERYTARRR